MKCKFIDLETQEIVKEMEVNSPPLLVGHFFIKQKQKYEVQEISLVDNGQVWSKKVSPLPPEIDDFFTEFSSPKLGERHSLNCFTQYEGKDILYFFDGEPVKGFLYKIQADETSFYRFLSMGVCDIFRDSLKDFYVEDEEGEEYIYKTQEEYQILIQKINY